MSDLTVTADIAVSGMKAQAERLRLISENMANADSVSTEPGGEPYRRQVPVFKNYLDAANGAELVKVEKVVKDSRLLRKNTNRTIRQADAEGYVSLPNVNPLIEMMDMKEAQRSYEANLNVMKTARDMNSKVLDLLK